MNNLELLKGLDDIIERNEEKKNNKLLDMNRRYDEAVIKIMNFAHNVPELCEIYDKCIAANINLPNTRHKHSAWKSKHKNDFYASAFYHNIGFIIQNDGQAIWIGRLDDEEDAVIKPHCIEIPAKEVIFKYIIRLERLERFADGLESFKTSFLECVNNEVARLTSKK